MLLPISAWGCCKRDFPIRNDASVQRQAPARAQAHTRSCARAEHWMPRGSPAPRAMGWWRDRLGMRIVQGRALPSPMRWVRNA